MKASGYTKIFLNAMNEEITDELVQKKSRQWWYNIRDKENSGLRLTELGYITLLKNEFIFHKVEYSDKNIIFDSQLLLFLDKFIDCPFFITEKFIFVMSSKKAVELSLISGDIRQYANNKSIINEKKKNKKKS